MGIAASQARMLMLTARKSNIEFQGQQINQQRTTLANETSAYNSQLLGLTVPTAPSSSDYAATVYKMSLNGNTCTISPKGIVYDEKANTYTVPYTYETTVTQAESAGTKTFSGDYATGFKASNGNALTLLDKSKTSDAATIAQMEQDLGIAQFTLTYDSDTTTTGTQASVANLTKVDTTTQSELDALKAGVGAANYSADTTYYKYSTTVDGTTKTYYVDAAQLATASGVSGSASTGIKPYIGGAKLATDVDIRENQFYSFVSGGKTTYVLASEANDSAVAAKANEDANVNTYYINDSATTTKTAEITDATITWSDSGRISSIADSNGNKYAMTTSTTTNEDAYTDAMNEYEFQKQVYEQSINNINAKLDIVQQQDKTLSLQLTQLDTEQKSVQTEQEAVKKVLEKNAEAFKTFA